MRASLKKKKQIDFLSKLAEGRKLSNPGERQWQREIKTWMGGLWVRTKSGRERKRKRRGRQMKPMFKTEVVIDN